MSTEDKRVREFAYQIWESEGKPEGQEARHWEMARKLAEAEALTPSKPKTGTKAKAKPAAEKPAVAKNHGRRVSLPADPPSHRSRPPAPAAHSTIDLT